ncbi:MAG: glucose 1-dehydrogenase [Caldilineaceae bacterium]|nr:glucose 1-dehydrogenase [Caldilineaceae bacterium]
MRLQERVAFVTGGGSGIGQAICRLFAAEGASVVTVDRYLERAQATAAQIEAAGGRALALYADVAQPDSVSAAAQTAQERLGPVDILVNNAAIAEGDDILTIDEATWDLNLAVALKSVYLCSRALLPGMLARRRGAIVNIASVNGLTGIGEEPYSAAKAGVINLTKNLAVRYGSQGVRANVICPGTIQTPIWQSRLDIDPTVFDRLAKWYPLGRVGQPDDVAKAALFLASDDAAWITGAVLNVDGGLMAGSYRMARDLAAAEG